VSNILRQAIFILLSAFVMTTTARAQDKERSAQELLDNERGSALVPLPPRPQKLIPGQPPIMASPGYAPAARPAAAAAPARVFVARPQGSELELIQNAYAPLSDSELAIRWLLPPKKYDHPFRGEGGFLIGHANPNGLRQTCPTMMEVWGCAWDAWRGRPGHSCTIILLDDDRGIERFGLTPRIVFRHAIGHCNEWPRDHPGAR
jgi:hypothetical protein